jgi:hypothetical protein
MITISKRAAAALVIAASFAPVLFAAAFMGADWLWQAPLSPRVLMIAVTASLAALLIRLRQKRVAGRQVTSRTLLEEIRGDALGFFLPGALIVLVTFPSAAFSVIKAGIPAYVPFYADPFFVQADRWLFLGVDPWRVSHALLGTWGTIAIDRLYVLWFTLFPFLAIWIGASRDRSFQFRGVMAVYFVLIVLGNALALALSSSGPIFYEYFFGSDYYDPLIARLAQANETYPITALRIADWLIEMNRTSAFGSGISAMPSVHCGFAVLTFLMVHERVRARWARWASGVYALTIWIGSFHLAWHYAWDGIVSAVLVWLAWRALGRIEVRKSTPREDFPSA